MSADKEAKRAAARRAYWRAWDATEKAYGEVIRATDKVQTEATAAADKAYREAIAEIENNEGADPSAGALTT